CTIKEVFCDCGRGPARVSALQPGGLRVVGVEEEEEEEEEEEVELASMMATPSANSSSAIPQPPSALNSGLSAASTQTHHCQHITTMSSMQGKESEGEKKDRTEMSGAMSPCPPLLPVPQVSFETLTG
ncbi:dual specificity mitogen-activated protein kinase kinase 4a isoform X3, partial [Tachysurus ichikawai]